MRIEFEVSRDETYYRALQHGLVSPVVRRIVVLAVALGLIGPLMIWVSAGEGLGTLLGFVAFLAAPFLLVRARRVRAVLLAVPEGWTSRRRYVITEDALESGTELTQARWQWEAVRTVEVLPAAYLLRQAGGMIFDLPRSPLTEAQETELLALLAARGLIPAGAGAV